MEPGSLKPERIEANTGRARSNLPIRLATWAFFLAFAALVALLAARSLQPRMPGMPATGGTMTMPSDASPPPADGQPTPAMPGMKSP